ncbi:retrovirus-related pol polyprotein from transposon TNT 1-94 [Tanacetum coccineum]
MVDGKVDKVPSTSTLVDPTSSSWARPVLTNARLAVEVFDGTGHFGMWQSEVLDAFFQKGLDIAVEESKPEDVEEKNWLTINRLACGTIGSCLSREQRYAFSKETSAYKLWVALEEKFMKKNCQNKLFTKKRLFHFTYVPGVRVCIALYSKELRRKDKQISSSGDAEVLLVRGRSQKKGTDKRWRSKSRQRLSKDECAFCQEKGNWKSDCLRLKTKDTHYKRKAVEEYELIETTLLNGKDDVSLSEVCTALYSKELRRKDKQISLSGDAEVLPVRGHWKRDCPRLKTKDNHYKGKAVEEYELLETTLLNGKDDVSFSEVCTALYSKELRRKDKQISSSGDAWVLLVRGRSQKKGTDKRRRSKSRQRLSKDECAFCHEKGHWKRDCPRLKTKDNHYKGKAVAEANVTKCDLGQLSTRHKINGREYKNDLFTKFYEDEGIVRHFTVRHTPQQKVVAEQLNRLAGESSVVCYPMLVG